MRSNYERSTGNAVRRDCGYSSPLPGRPGWSIWLFCDTVVTSAGGRNIERLILGTDTAADGPYQAGRAPGWLSEVPTPPALPAPSSTAAPQPFLPAPDGLQLPGSTLPCTGPGSYPAAWISGVTRAPSAAAAAAGGLLISYDGYCVTGSGDGPVAEGFGLAEYYPAHNLLGPATLVFGSSLGMPLPQQQVLGSPVMGADGYLYLFGFCNAAPPQAGCGAGRVFLARTVAAPAYWRNPFTYQYWTGDGWSPRAAAAGSLIPAGHPLGISVGDYTADGQGVVMIQQTSLAGGFQAWRRVAGRPVAPAPRRPGAVHAGHQARYRQPVPRTHRASGTQHYRRPADLLLRSGKSTRGRGPLSMVRVTREASAMTLTSWAAPPAGSSAGAQVPPLGPGS